MASSSSTCEAPPSGASGRAKVPRSSFSKTDRPPIYRQTRSSRWSGVCRRKRPARPSARRRRSLAHPARNPLEAEARVDRLERDEDLHADGGHRPPPRARTTSASKAGVEARGDAHARGADLEHQLRGGGHRRRLAGHDAQEARRGLGRPEPLGPRAQGGGVVATPPYDVGHGLAAGAPGAHALGPRGLVGRRGRGRHAPEDAHGWPATEERGLTQRLQSSGQPGLGPLEGPARAASLRGSGR